MRDKNFVAMDCCIVCGEPQGILLDKKMRKTLDMKQSTSIEPCEKCLEANKGNIFLYESIDGKTITGSYCIVSRVAFQEMVNIDLGNSNVCFIDPEVFKHLVRIKIEK